MCLIICICKSYLKGQWVWTDGTDWDYENWGFGEPSNQTDHDCLLAQPDGIVDFDCTELAAAVCKMKIEINA